MSRLRSQEGRTSEDEIRCVELRPELWPALEKLFGANGAWGGCWCMWWRAERGGKFWKQLHGPRAKRAFSRLIASGGVRGILAFSGERPVGWCSFGPRSDFPRLDRTKAFKRSDVDGVWSINCFYIARDFRAQGLARKLLDAAIRACARQGARIVEAYPITTTADGGKVSSAFAYTGPLCIFEEQGFEVVQRLSATRPLVRRALGP